MKLGVRESMVPGANLPDKLSFLERFGYDGIELHAAYLDRPVDELVAAFRGRSVGVATVSGYPTLLNLDRKARDEAMAGIPRRLELAAALGAPTVLVIPIVGPAQIPDLMPYRACRDLERDLLVAQLKVLAPVAERLRVHLNLEPQNRYQTHFLNRVEQGVEICEAVGSPWVNTMADFFHMNIEEADVPTAIRSAGRRIVHVHVADNNRLQPGRGQLDLRPGFAALRSVGYDGYLVLECTMVGEPEAAFREAADIVRAAWAAA